MAGQMAHARQDVCQEFPISSDLGKVERAVEMLPGKHGLTGIICHPPGHLRECGRCGEHRLCVSANDCAEKVRRNGRLKVLHHRWIEVASTDLPVCVTK